MSDIPAFIRHAPVAPQLPLVLDSPHSGEHYPEDFDHAPPRDVVRQAEDTHVARLYAFAPKLGATLIEAVFPRAYIDANRSLDDIDPAMLADNWPTPLVAGPKTAKGIGLLWRIARDGAQMYTRKLTVAEVQRRIDRWYRPYHAALAGELDVLHRRFGAVWHIDCHSMPAIGDAYSDDAGRPRKDFVLGDRDGTTCAPEFTALVAETLAGQGYSVAINDPYKGVEIVRRCGRPREHRHSLQIELNRRLYMNETTLEPTPSYASLEADLQRMLAAVSRYVRAQV
ncbi:MAG TPA: N-formylglutamate amidohydrolase [Casimicrobiaceae bacterium]|nr:N-formylglutamate amidohydrolase [Casimicrobiaceae bacterium]